MRYPTEAYRGKMPHGGQAFSGRASISKDLQVRILEIDNKLELHDLHKAGLHMYRCIRKGGSSSEDVLFHQFDLIHPPGEWLIQCLRECDTWSKYGGPQRATRAIKSKMKDRNDEWEEKAMKAITEISEANAADMIRKVERKRVMVVRP